MPSALSTTASGSIFRWLLAAGLTLFSLPALSTSADRTGPIRQMNHRTWTVANGAPADIWDMKDDANGFIWLATGDGLFRFDGLQFDPYRPLSGQFASKNMTALQIISTDELWVGTADGTISHVDHGRVTNYAISAATNHGLIYRFAVTPDGVLWVVTAQKLLRFSGVAFEPVDAGWSLPVDSRPSWVAVDANGTLWLATDRELLFLQKDQRQFHQTGIPVGVHAVLTVAPSGTLWVSDGRYGTRPLPGLSLEHVPDALRKPSLSGTLVRTQRLAFDDDGAMWGTLSTSGDIRGVIRVKDAARITQPLRQDRLGDLYTPEDGLTSVTATPIFVDREGDVWVGTNFGLNRFHPNTFTMPEPTRASPSAMAWVTPGYDKSVRVLHRQCLYEVSHAISEQLTCKFPHGTNMLIDTGTHSYSATEDELFEWDRSGAGGPIPFPENVLLTSLNAAAVDAGHHLWLGMAEGIFKRDNHQWQKIDLGRSVGVSPPSAMAFDWLNILWLGYADGRIARKTGDGAPAQVLMTHTVIGAVQAIYPQGDTVYFGGDAGFGRQRYGRFNGVLMSQLGLTGTVTGVAVDRAGNLWLNASQGVIRIDADDVEKMFDIPGFRPRFRVYGSDDGVPGIGLVQYVASTITVDEDGRLWFATNQGVSWIDPKSVRVNPVAPRTVIKSIRADGKDYSVADRLMLPPKTAAVTFDFTAASYRSPQNVLFKYRLLGFDPAWQESGTLRNARYTNLPPGTYHFQVVAANSDGIWSESPAQLTFAVEPTFYQQLRFRVLLAAGLSLAIFALFLFQHRKAMLRLRDRLEARHAERESIARDLHDTLIQGIQGLLLSFHAVSERLPHASRERGHVELALDRAEEMLEEGRARVQDMRFGDSQSEDLAIALATVGDALSKQRDIAFKLIRKGLPRMLSGPIRSEVYLIGREALLNAFRHSHAKAIEVEIAYDKKALVVRIYDDGAGIDESVLASGSKPGHWGLVGMHERADGIGSRLGIWARPGAGTQVQLSIPARVIYVDTRQARWKRVTQLVRRSR